jgi:hypothetical protein
MPGTRIRPQGPYRSLPEGGLPLIARGRLRRSPAAERGDPELGRPDLQLARWPECACGGSTPWKTQRIGRPCWAGSRRSSAPEDWTTQGAVRLGTAASMLLTDKVTFSGTCPPRPSPHLHTARPAPHQASPSRTWRRPLGFPSMEGDVQAVPPHPLEHLTSGVRPSPWQEYWVRGESLQAGGYTAMYGVGLSGRVVRCRRVGLTAGWRSPEGLENSGSAFS